MLPEGVPGRISLVLGAGASRGVSYADAGDILSPLDADFFDLLQRAATGTADSDEKAVAHVIAQVQKLPYDYWRSMERAFYTLHLRAYMAAKLTADNGHPDERVIKEFAQCVQVLLRKAHGKHTCTNHQQFLQVLHETDTVISFNYDLVPERALKPIAEERMVPFGRWLYGLSANTRGLDLPVMLKLHGSSNWKLTKGRTSEVIEVRTKTWEQLDETPGYRGHLGEGTAFPIFLPFWDKRIERRPWLHLWKTAYERLANVEAVIVWGYSLPPTDIKAQHFFSLALGNRPVTLCVIDPSEATRRRWRELLPQALYFPYNSVEHFLQAPPRWWRQPAA
jgi:hypothetical protein